MKGLRFPEGERGMLLGTYELHVQQAIAEHLQPGGVFFDIGAHRGYFSLLAASLVGAQGHVYSFEPLPTNASDIERVMALNQVFHDTVIGKAVSRSAGTASLWIGDGNAYRPSLFRWKGGRQHQVETISLDTFIRTHRVPHVIKVDVEGAEAMVLEGATELLASEACVTWIIEIHDEQVEHEVRRLLTQHLYQLEALNPIESAPKTYPKHLLARKHGA